MTLNYNLMYWFTRLDNINNLFEGVAALGGFCLIILAVAYFVSDASKSFDEEAADVNKKAKKFFKILFFPWLFAILGLIFVPTSKEMAMIYVVPNIAESQVIKQDIPEVYDLGINALKDWLKKNKEQ